MRTTTIKAIDTSVYTITDKSIDIREWGVDFTGERTGTETESRITSTTSGHFMLPWSSIIYISETND